MTTTLDGTATAVTDNPDIDAGMPIGVDITPPAPLNFGAAAVAPAQPAPWGTLYDCATETSEGPATFAQWHATVTADPDAYGMFTVDEDGNPQPLEPRAPDDLRPEGAKFVYRGPLPHEVGYAVEIGQGRVLVGYADTFVDAQRMRVDRFAAAPRPGTAPRPNPYTVRPYLRADADAMTRYAGTQARQVADRLDRHSDATYAAQIAVDVLRRLAARDVPATS